MANTSGPWKAERVYLLILCLLELVHLTEQLWEVFASRCRNLIKRGHHIKLLQSIFLYMCVPFYLASVVSSRHKCSYGGFFQNSYFEFANRK